MTTRLEAVCTVLCKSGKFETGEGTCAPICMGMLGDARRNCGFRVQVHMKIGAAILGAIDALETAEAV